MKKSLIYFLIMFSGLCTNQLIAQGANECIVTNTIDWTVASDVDGDPTTFTPGPFNMPPVLIPDGCLDPAIISCICAGQPQILPQVGTCNQALEIWGEDFGCVNNVPCSYPPNSIYYFQTTFNFTDSCHVIDSFLVQVQADNFMDFRINGISVLNTFANNNLACPPFPLPGNIWNTTFSTNTTACFNTNVANAINPNGLNTITIMVQNAGGGCLNYAFLSLCAKFWTHEEQLDANFTLSSVDNGDETFDLVGASINPTAGENHEWYIMNRPYNTTDPFNPVGVISGINNLNYLSDYCLSYRVIHRVFMGDGACEECYLKDNGGVCEPELGPEDEETRENRQRVPCEILDEFRWPRLEQAGEGGGDSASEEGRNGLQNRLKLAGKISVTPNPASTVVALAWDLPESKILKVFALDGQLVIDKALTDGQTYLDLNVRNWTAGVYIIQLLDDNGKSYTEKLNITKK